MGYKISCRAGKNGIAVFARVIIFTAVYEIVKKAKKSLDSRVLGVV